MKKTYIISSLIVLLLHSCKTKVKEAEEEKFKSAPELYLGQTPPGETPIPFAPGLVSTNLYEVNSAFTPDLKAFYFIRRGEENKESAFYEYKYNETNARWEKSEIASPWIGRPVISPDGKTMHLGDSYLKKMDSGWSKLQKLEPPTISNDSMYIMRLSSSSNGTYYFDTYKENDPTFPIRYSRLINGKHEAPKALPKAINTGTFLNHPFIAPDESYLLFDAVREDGYGDSDIYISFKQKDGTWGNAINLGDKINTNAWESSASITPDGKYLFFSRNIGSENFENVDVFWVDAKAVMRLKNNSKSLVAILDTIWQTEQTPIRLRDSIGRALGFESDAFKKQDSVYHKNHAVNEIKVTRILDSLGWPSSKLIGEQGNLTLCNVLQHASLAVREKYLPLMKKAVKDKELSARFLVRAEDRIATDKNELQIYGGQIKYYPETKSFNFWPIKDPENLEKRRAAMGLDSIAAFLQRKGVDLEWNLKEQIQRTKAFELAKQHGTNN